MRHYESAAVLADYHCKLTKTSVTQDFFKLLNIPTWIHFTFAILPYRFTATQTKQFTSILCCAKHSFTKAFALVSQVQMCHILTQTRLVYLPKTGQRSVWVFAGCSSPPSACALRWGGDKQSADTRQQKLIMHFAEFTEVTQFAKKMLHCWKADGMAQMGFTDPILRSDTSLTVIQTSGSSICDTGAERWTELFNSTSLCLHAHTTSCVAACLENFAITQLEWRNATAKSRMVKTRNHITNIHKKQHLHFGT